MWSTEWHQCHRPGVTMKVNCAVWDLSNSYTLAATILDRESDKSSQWIKEAVNIRKEGRQSLNWDEGSYTLSNTYDWFLATSHLYRGKNRKKIWTSFFWWRSLAETEMSTIKCRLCVMHVACNFICLIKTGGLLKIIDTCTLQQW